MDALFWSIILLMLGIVLIALEVFLPSGELSATVKSSQESCGFACQQKMDWKCHRNPAAPFSQSALEMLPDRDQAL